MANGVDPAFGGRKAQQQAGGVDPAFGGKAVNPLGAMTKRFNAGPEEVEAMIRQSMQDNAGRAGEIKAGLDKSEKQSIQDRMVETFWEQPAWKRGLVTLADEVGLAGSGATFGLADKAVAGWRAARLGKNYDEELAKQRELNDNARARLNAITPGAGTFMEVAPGVMGPGLVAKGAGPVGRGIARMAEGAGYGGLSWLGGDDMSAKNLAANVGLGMGLGGGGGVIADTIGAGVRGLGRAVTDWAGRAREPAEKVWAQVSRAFNDAGWSKADIDEAIAKYGPETLIADILPGGPKQLSKAGNISTEAREIAEDRFAQRNVGRNDRLVESAAESVGLPISGMDEGMRAQLAKNFRDTANRPVQRQKWISELDEKAQKETTDRIAADQKFRETERKAFPPEPSISRIALEGMATAGLGAGAGVAGDWLLGYGDPLTGGLLGAGWKGYKQAAPLLRKAVTRTKGATAKNAPYVADVLTSPASELELAPISSYEDAVDRGRDFLARLATRGGLQAYQQFGGPR